ncbi:MAG: carbohydrate ABC transporter permease [Eubacteriales bacterium]|nr:carbohydrate ABC transporter permease [Eubacteriales bacterium]
MIKTNNKNSIKRTLEDNVISIVVGIIISIVFFVTIYPFWYCIVLSFNEGTDALRGGIYLWPRKFTFDNYYAVIGIEYIPMAFFVSVCRTLIGTILCVAFTGLFAYSISHENLIGRKLYITAMLIIMYFSGGLIPQYMLYKNLGLMNTFWVYIIPNLFAAFNAVIMMNAFREVPKSLEEAAIIDGANDMRVFFQIILPVTMPTMATMALYSGVWHWNTWTDSAFFISNKNLKTLSNIMINLINQSESAAQTLVGNLNQSQVTYTSMTLRPAAMIICVLPIVAVYPFLQKYFVKGVMIGSIK